MSQSLKSLAMTSALTMAAIGACAEQTPVTIDNFVRAATDIEFRKYLAQSGSVNTLFHVREPTPLDRQPTIRMNRDTLYSMAVVDISDGALLTVPETGIAMSRFRLSIRITTSTTCSLAVELMS